jgi:hypothetical protein
MSQNPRDLISPRIRGHQDGPSSTRWLPPLTMCIAAPLLAAAPLAITFFIQ